MNDTERMAQAAELVRSAIAKLDEAARARLAMPCPPQGHTFEHRAAMLTIRTIQANARNLLNDLTTLY